VKNWIKSEERNYASTLTSTDGSPADASSPASPDDPTANADGRTKRRRSGASAADPDENLPASKKAKTSNEVSYIYLFKAVYVL
jgi:hypothetical protein